MGSELITYDEIRNYPIAFRNQLIEEPSEDSFLIHQYGPWIAMTHESYLTSHYNTIKTDIVRFIAGVAHLLHTGSLMMPVGYIKKECLSVARLDCGKYSDQLNAIAIDMLHFTKKVQYEEQALESAILSCAPIVQYSRNKLSNPELFDLEEDRCDEVKSIFWKGIDQTILTMLTGYICDILLRNDRFIGPHLSYTDSYQIARNLNTNDPVVRYFLIVHMRHTSKSEEEFREKKEALINLKILGNKIINGEAMKVLEFMDAFRTFCGSSC